MPRAPKICSGLIRDDDGQLMGCPNTQPCPVHYRKPWTGGRRMPPGWAKTRARILERDPICKLCDRSPSTDVDHIYHRDDHRDEALRGVCRGCHQARSSRQGGLAKAEAERRRAWQ